MPEKIIISVDGKAQEDLIYSLVEVVVDTNIFMPAMFSLVIQDNLDFQKGSFDFIDSESVFAVGKEVKIEVETDEIPDESASVKATLIMGEITSVEPSFTAEGIALLGIRGYDYSYRLTQGKKTRTFGDGNPSGSGISDDQIVSTILQECSGISGSNIDTSGLSGVKYHYVMQYNQTDWEFLWTRARLMGYQVYVDNTKKLCFQKADAHRGNTSDKPAKLTWGMNLQSFQPRMSALGQYSKVTASGWDISKKELVTQTSTSVSDKNLASTAITDTGTKLIKKEIGEVEDFILSGSMETTNQAKAMAHARHLEAESSFIKAEGQCREGDPRLIAGRMVTIDNVGKRFGGDYYVTEARHEWVGGQYFVRFSAAGYSPNTLQALLDKNEPGERDHLFGVVVGKVTNLDDPEALGRIRVVFPWMPKYKSAELESNWARMASPAAGKERGFFFMPEVDDEVLVSFEQGDLNRPYIVGVLWNKTDKPPEGTAAVLASDKKKINQRVVRSRSGHLVILDDTEGEEKIIIQDKTSKNSIMINSKDNSMVIKAAGDLTFEAGGKFIMKSTGDFSVDSKAKTSIKSQSDLTLDSMSKALMKCSSNQLALQMAGAELKGMKLDLTASTSAALKGSAMVEISGALVKIN